MEKEIIINEADLRRLLEMRKSLIGNPASALWTEILGFAGISISIWQIEAEFFRYVLGAVAAFVAWRIYKMVIDRYSAGTLETEIKALDKVRHRHALIAIKDTFNPFPNRYLTYYDEAWDCPFLLNYKSAEEHVLRRGISQELKIPENEIKLERVGVESYRKFSEEAKREKWYEHTLYQAEISDFPALLRQEAFEIDGRHYEWLTIYRMKIHPRVIKANMDVVHMIENAHI